jgi:hypothetical protein
MLQFGKVVRDSKSNNMQRQSQNMGSGVEADSEYGLIYFKVFREQQWGVREKGTALFPRLYCSNEAITETHCIEARESNI